MKICEKIKSEISLSEGIGSKAGLGIAVNNFSKRLKQILKKHKLKVTNYDLDEVCDYLVKGKKPKKSSQKSSKVRWRKIHKDKLDETKIKLKAEDVFKGDKKIPNSFKEKYVDAFNAFASIIADADDELFTEVGRKEYLKHFLQIEVETE